MSEQGPSHTAQKLKELQPFFMGIGLGVGLILFFVLLGLALGLWPALVPPGYDFAQPR